MYTIRINSKNKLPTFHGTLVTVHRIPVAGDVISLPGGGRYDVMTVIIFSSPIEDSDLIIAAEVHLHV